MYNYQAHPELLPNIVTLLALLPVLVLPGLHDGLPSGGNTILLFLLLKSQNVIMKYTDP